MRLVAVADRTGTDSGVVIEALPKRQGRLRRMTLGPVDAWRALRRIQPEMIHVHDPELIPLAILWKLSNQRPAVFDAHEDLAKQVAGKTYIPLRLRPMVARFTRLIERAADRFLSGVVAATPSIAQNFRHAPVVLVQNFPWTRDFPEPVDDRTGQPLTFCYVGGVSKERGGLEMVSLVGDSPASPRLIVAGAITPDVLRAIKADKTGRIDYRGILRAGDIPDLIRESTAGLVLLHPMPNYLESQPTKIFEYMAAGKPYIASDFAAWRNLLGKYDCGYFVDPFDRDALVEIVEQIAANPAEAREKGMRGRRALVEHFTFETESQRLEEFVHRLLDTSPVRTCRSVEETASHVKDETR